MSHAGPWGQPLQEPTNVEQIVQETRERMAEIFPDATRTQLRAALVALHAGTATTVQHQRITEALIRALLREP